jgi:hypothetical protein
MTDAQPPQSPAPTPMRTPAPGDDGPEGIGGWLILPLIGLFGSIVLTLFNALPLVSEWNQLGPVLGAYLDGTLAPQYHGAALVTLIGAAEVVVFVGYAIFCIVQFLQKKRQVPTLMTIFYVLLAGGAVLDYYAIAQIMGPLATEADRSEAAIEIFRAAVICAIWIPYFQVSKRVKNTFVN